MLKDIPYDDSYVIPIQIITEDFIITKINKKSFTHENNQFLPLNNIKISKKEFKLDEFKDICESYDKIKQGDFWKSFYYVLGILVVWLYFISVNIQTIILFLTIDFGNVSDNIFLLWLAMVTYFGFYNFLNENIRKPIITKFRFQVEHFNPSDLIVKKNEVNQFILFASQLFYFFIFYILYYPNIKIEINKGLLGVFYVGFFIGAIISIHYLLIIVFRHKYNLKIKKKILVFSYELLQNSNFQSENYHLIIKMINDIENNKLISFGFISKIVGIITFFFAIIPNII